MGKPDEAGLGHWDMYGKGKIRGLSLNIDLTTDIKEQVIKRGEDLERAGKPQNNGTCEAPYSSRRDEVLRDIRAARGGAPSLKLLEFGYKLGCRHCDLKKYGEASSVLEAVWVGQRSQPITRCRKCLQKEALGMTILWP